MVKIVKNTTFSGLTDIIAPHSCRGCGHIGSPLCECCKNYIILQHQNICPNCKSLNPTSKCPKCPHMPPTFVLGDRTSIIGTIVHDFKYSSVTALAQPISELLDNILPEILGNVSIIPLPTISRHIRERGFDHTAKIAHHLTKLRPGWRVQSIILRQQNTVQVGASETARKTQAKKAYQVNPKIPIDPNTTYILFDDVWTTGASMQAALKILASAGAQKIIILILALSQKKN